MNNPETNEAIVDEPRSEEAERCCVVGVGASAGGLDALEKLFSSMPADTGMAFVVVQHLSPDFKSLMDELLARHTNMPIHRVEDGMTVEPNGIYLIPPKKNMVISGQRLLLTDQDLARGLNLPIDIFFRSLAQDAGSRAIGIVLSGTGSDGSRGLQDIHEAGGLIFVQDMQSAAFDGMPRSAIATGLANVVAQPAEIAKRLCSYMEDPENFPLSEPEVEIPILPGGELSAIFRVFRSRYGIDFTLYKESTIHRRIDRRMQLIHCAEISEYVRLLMEDSQELDALYRDLLVEVTHFFRDPQAYDRLRDDVVPQLLDSVRGPHDEIRVWVPGCATGEEAYSLAMLLDDLSTRGGVSPPIIKVFATDVHRSSLEIASSGVYSSESLANVPSEYRQRYFTNHGSLFQVTRPIRQMVIFAPHDITRDPPFTKVDLISCRNVLIYLEPAVQKRVLSLFHFGLKVRGTMLLGPSESIGELSSEFDTVDQHWRIFQKLRDVRLPDASSVRLASPLFSVVRAKAPLPPFGASKGNDFIESTVLENLLDQYVPPSFLVNSRFELVHSFGQVRDLIRQPKGRPTLELLKMVEGDLRMGMSAALHRVAREKERVVLQGIRIQDGDRPKFVQVIADPYRKGEHDLFLVSVKDITDEPSPADPKAETFRADDQAAQRIIDLERELEFSKESLQTTVEELESSNEELQSTNEELVAANEELQSTNEELHSVNEELYTVNAEHQRKIDELSQLTADMDNLMRSTEIGTIFLDRDLRIRRFTPDISSAFNILEQDIGRPIDQFAYQFESPGWLGKAREVARTGEPYEVELRARHSDKVYLKRMRPYRNSGGAITGVVITFTDVTAVARAEAERRHREHLERVTRDLQDFAYAVSHDLQAPARQIGECVNRVVESLDGTLNDEAGHWLSRMKDRTRQLRLMLDYLLEYSRINTRGQAFETVNLNHILSELREELADAIQAVGAELVSDDLPTIQADPVQMHKLLWHLLDNALKYCGNESPRIEVIVEREEGAWKVAVRDNGIGIDQRHLDEVFVIFRRLGMKDDVEGFGVGLALCRRILERHHGSVWAESSSLGSTFYFQIPDKAV